MMFVHVSVSLKGPKCKRLMKKQKTDFSKLKILFQSHVFTLKSLNVLKSSRFVAGLIILILFEFLEHKKSHKLLIIGAVLQIKFFVSVLCFLFIFLAGKSFKNFLWLSTCSQHKTTNSATFQFS